MAIEKNPTSLSQYKYNKSSPGVMRTPKIENRMNPIEPRTFFGLRDPVVGKCSMISRERFIVDVDFNQRLVDFFKTMSSRLYGEQSCLIIIYLRYYQWYGQLSIKISKKV